jgi:quercetin dioxygenase-like cupin family protein
LAEKEKAMRMRALTLGAALLAAAFGAGLLAAREDTSQDQVAAQELLVEDLAGEPGQEVNAQLYTFPPGSSVPWHIHPGAHEIAYILEGTLTFERDGAEPVEIRAGEADYLPPNIVHRGMNKGTEPVKLFVVRIKPKGKPLTEEVQP